MRVLFLCGSLGPGLDGVGDYVRRLAGELSASGHNAAIIALNDKSAPEVIKSCQEEGIFQIPILRLPDYMTWNERSQQSKSYIQSFHPDWISLQYVPFAFQDKGLPYYFSSFIKGIIEERNLHIMFHELSVGINTEASIKFKLWGYVQRLIVQLMLKDLKPKLVHTQSRIFQTYLSRYRDDVNYLPLFSNIPLAESPEQTFDKVDTAGKKDISLIIFGSIHSGVPLTQFAKELGDYVRNEYGSIKLFLIGRTGKETNCWSEAFEAEGIAVEILGERSTMEISKVLNDSTIGISTNPIAMIDKSGTFAAMREHCLPVISVSNSWTPRVELIKATSESVLEYSEGTFVTFALNLKRIKRPGGITQIAKQFADCLSKASA